MADQLPWRYEEDGYTVTRSCIYSPPGCHPVGCGVKLYVKNGKLEKVEGDETHPVSQGRLCPRCLSHTQYEYHQNRIRHPLKRVGERGEGKWEEITWDEAYDIIEERVQACKEEFGPENILVIGGTGRQAGPILGQFCIRMLGTPNGAYCQSGYSCYLPRVATCATNMGIPYPEMDYAGGFADRYDDPRFTLPQVMVMWGKEPMPANADGHFGYSVHDMMKRGAKVISIDPRLNWLASRSAIHLRLRCGTDTALALAWLNIIINEELYDKDFVERWCYGFEELAERVQEYPPSLAADITGCPEEDIIASARMYATAKPASLCWGLAVDQKSNGVQLAHALMCLMAITGNIDVPGGQTAGPATAALSGTDAGKAEGAKKGGFAALPKELSDKLIGLKEYPAYAALTHNANADGCLKAMETGYPYPIKVLFISSSNLLAATCAAAPVRWHNAMRKVPFVFATETFLTPTVQCCADIVLPLTTAAEHDTVVKTHYGATPVTTAAQNKAADPGDCKSDYEIMFELGKRIMPNNFRYDDAEEFLSDFQLGPGKGDMPFDDLRKQVVFQRPCNYRKYETGELREDGQPGFKTGTGRVELYSLTFEHFGDDPLPYYEEPQYSPRRTPELLADYPLVYTTGARVHAFFHSENRQQEYCRELNPDPLIEINPEDAVSRAIVSGDWCEVENQFGSALFKAKVTKVVPKGTVMCQHGWWFPEEDGAEPHLFGVWRSNANCLVPIDHVGKMGMGAPFKCMLCEVRKHEFEYDYSNCQKDAKITG